MATARTELEASGLQRLDELLTKNRVKGYYGEVVVAIKFVDGVPTFLEVTDRFTQHSNNIQPRGGK